MATCNNKRTLSKGLRIALIILGAFALLYVIGMVYSSWTNKRFEQNGVRTFATVTDVQVKHHPEHTSWVRGGNGTRRKVHHQAYTETIIQYTYSVEGVKYEGEMRTRTVPARPAKKDQKIQFEYLSNAPSKSRLYKPQAHQE